MKTLAIDPGVSNCAYVVLDGYKPIYESGFFNFSSKHGTWQQRVSKICQTLQNVSVFNQCSIYTTELYFGGGGAKIAKARSQVNYQRGGFDLMLQIALGHMYKFSVHPIQLKKVITGNGNANKRAMKIAIRELASKVCPEWLVHLDAEYTGGKQEHILEAYSIGLVTYFCWTDNKKLADEILTPRQVEILREVKRRHPWEYPHFKKPQSAPIIPDGRLVNVTAQE